MKNSYKTRTGNLLPHLASKDQLFQQLYLAVHIPKGIWIKKRKEVIGMLIYHQIGLFGKSIKHKNATKFAVTHLYSAMCLRHTQ